MWSALTSQVCYPSRVSSVLRVSCAAAFCVAALAEAPARASDVKSASLSWFRMPGADSCVATQHLARAVEARLGRPVFVSAAEADLSVEGRIERRRGAGWHAVLTLRDARGATLGTRELDRSDLACDTMTESLALVVAVMIDPEGAIHGRTPDAPPATAPEPSAPQPAKAPAEASREDEPPRPIPPPPPPALSRFDPWRFEAHAQATINHGLAPTLAPGAGVQAVLYPPTIPLGLRGYVTLFLPTEVERDGARASFDMLYGGGALCPTLRGRVNLLGCFGGQLGFLRPRAMTPGRGIHEDLLPIFNAMFEVRAHAMLVAPFGVAAGLGAGVPIVRPELSYQRNAGGPDVLHEPTAYVLTADLGVGFVFP